jgi:hypothetical protein
MRTYQIVIDGHGIISTRTTEREYTHAVVRIESDGRIRRAVEYCGSKALAEKKASAYKRLTDEVRVVEVKDVSELLNKAYNFGAQAFKGGKPAVPALDENFINEIFRGMKPGEESPCYVKSWLKGWMEENLKGGCL